MSVIDAAMLIIAIVWGALIGYLIGSTILRAINMRQANLLDNLLDNLEAEDEERYRSMTDDEE